MRSVPLEGFDSVVVSVGLVIGVESSQLGNEVFIGLGYHRFYWGARGSKILWVHFLVFSESGCIVKIQINLRAHTPRHHVSG